MDENQQQRFDKLFHLQARRFLYEPTDIHEHNYATVDTGGHLVSECRLCGHTLAIPIMGTIGGDDATITWNKAGKKMTEEDRERGQQDE